MLRIDAHSMKCDTFDDLALLDVLNQAKPSQHVLEAKSPPQENPLTT